MFKSSQSSHSETQINGSWIERTSRIGGRAVAGVLIGGFIASAAACATAGPYNPAGLAPEQLGQVQQICRSVMGAPVGTGLYSDCVANLSGSALAQGQADSRRVALDEARRSCLGRGSAASNPSLPVCELSTVSDHAATTADLASVRIDVTGLTAPTKSYFSASRGEVRRREQMACARLGYDPISASFANCVTSLDSALIASEHVMQ